MADGNVPLEDVFVAITDLVQAELRTNLNDSTTKSKLSRAMWDGVAFFGAGSPATLLEPHLSNYFSQLDASDLADYQAGGYIKRLFQHSMDAQGHMPKLDGERSVQTELFSSLFVAVRTSIWARKDRNRSVRSRSWEVRSDSGDKEGRTDYFLTINGKVRAAFELKRYEVLPNDQMEMACLALQSGGVTVSKDKIKWASTDLVERISFKTRGTIAHALSQVSDIVFPCDQKLFDHSLMVADPRTVSNASGCTVSRVQQCIPVHSIRKESIEKHRRVQYGRCQRRGNTSKSCRQCVHVDDGSVDITHRQLRHYSPAH